MFMGTDKVHTMLMITLVHVKDIIIKVIVNMNDHVDWHVKEHYDPTTATNASALQSYDKARVNNN
jgi:hypothetical protein